MVTFESYSLNHNHKIKMKYWLIKSEPFKYSWEQFVKDKVTVWDGVRNYAARNNLKAMKTGDQVFFYHSNEGLCIVGIAKVVKEYFQDPTTDEPAWVAVSLAPYKALKKPVTLEEMKTMPQFKKMDLIRLARLSVGAVTKEEYDLIMKMNEQK
jgi:predicted RNA-binding protein with PUA-like domain